ncbi:hypothetical protein [Paenibacillus lautus]|uniref:hypothetical protein n=1 Tax=Paenibacillus lautus TaxID=1401 RepID=UPI003D29AC72
MPKWVTLSCEAICEPVSNIIAEKGGPMKIDNDMFHVETLAQSQVAEAKVVGGQEHGPFESRN